MDEATFFLRLRENLQLDQEEFGELMGVSSSTVSRVESGQASYRYRNLRRLRKHLGISIDELHDLHNAGQTPWLGHYLALKSRQRIAINAIITASIGAIKSLV